MDCQGAQEEPEGRPGGPGRGNRSRGKAMVGGKPWLSKVPWTSWPSLWLFLGLLELHHGQSSLASPCPGNPLKSWFRSHRSQNILFDCQVQIRVSRLAGDHYLGVFLSEVIAPPTASTKSILLTCTSTSLLICRCMRVAFSTSIC